MRDARRQPRLVLPACALCAIVVLLALAGCSATIPSPTPTAAVIPLSAAAAVPVPARSTSQRVQSDVAASSSPVAATPSATPTRVLKAPLPTSLPTMLAGWRDAPTAQPAASGASQPLPAPAPALSGRIVLQTASGANIVVAGVQGGQPATVSHGMDPAWSPDGKQIAVTRWTEPQGLYLMSADGSNERLLYRTNGAKSPAWSPDGTKIAFTWLYKTVQRGGGSFKGTPLPTFGLGQDYWRVSIVDVNTGNKTDLPLDNDGFAFAPDWGPDGRVIYKALRGLGVSDEAGPATRLTDNQLQASPSWSPDGKRVVCMTSQHDHTDIVVMNSDGSGQTFLTQTPPIQGTTPVNNVAPAWSPDGRSIAFLSDRGSDWRIYVMNADGSGQRRLLDIAVQYDYAAERVLDWTK
jgi:dipeptidyl aminopeptidase/acylaminoacyl peptidase